MKRLLSLHLLVPAAVACFGMALILVGFLRNKQQLSERLQKDLWDQAYREGTRLSHIAQHLLRKGLVPAADLEMSYVALAPHLTLGVICDGANVVRHASQIQWKGVALSNTPLADTGEQLTDIRRFMSGRVVISPDTSRLLAVFPFFERNVQSKSVVILAYDLIAPQKEAARLALHESIAQSFGLLGGSIILWMLLDGLITRRISLIVSYADQVASGRSPVTPVTGQDEIGTVGRAFSEAVQQLRQTELQLLEAGERERRHLGMDLHDNICQRITAAQLKAGVLGAALRRAESPHQPFASQVAEDLSHVAEIARGYARGLAPVTLDGDGLHAAIRDMAEHLEKAFSVPVRFETDPRVQELPESLQVHLFRIAQELATNAAKHARASFIALRMVIHGGILSLEVENDGRSFKADTSSSRPGMGLQLIRQRLRAINGSLTFLERNSDIGHGTLARCEVPVDGMLAR